MTAPARYAPSPALIRLRLRAAAALCALTGIVGALRVIGIVMEVADTPSAPRLLLLTGPSAVLMVLIASVLLWRGRRLGVYLLILGAIMPDLVNLSYGQPLRRAGILMILTLIATALNWKELR
jgi:hypothetical protein